MPARLNYEATVRAYQNGTISRSLFYIRTRSAARRGNQTAIARLQADRRVIPATRRAMRSAVRNVERSLNRIRARRFGIEIEFTARDIQALIDNAARSGLTVVYEGYNHEVRPHWKIVTDSSCGYELVSPPLENCEASFEQVRKACKALHAANARVDMRCGLHIHIEAPQLSADEARAIVASYSKNQNVINSFLARSRRASSFATSWNSNELVAIQRAQSVAEIAAINSRLNGHRARYKAVSVQPFSRYGTIEFRQHQGTNNADKISNWVAFCVAMTNVTRELDAHSSPEALLAALNMSNEARAYFCERAMELAQ